METETLEKPTTVEDVICEASRIKGLLAEAMDEGVRQAARSLKRGRHAAEDAVEEARHRVKQYPFAAVGIALGAGLLLGGMIACLAARRNPSANRSQPKA
jgi:ElaB/YqjD/DUF883 family membrane-anchored ribosome-binding protein